MEIMSGNQNELNNLVVNFPPKPGVLNKLKSEGWFNDDSAKTIYEVLPDQIPSGGGASDPAGVFRFIASVNDISDLPSTDNELGDLYYVLSDSAEYVWLIDASTELGFWEKLGDAGERFVVTFSQSNGNWVTDKTTSEIGAARRNGKTIWFKVGNCAAMAFYQTNNPDGVLYEAHFLAHVNSAFVYRYDIYIVDLVGPVVNVAMIPNEKTVNVTGSTPMISAAANTIYKCGTLTSLTVDSVPASGAWSIVFTSGATPTITTFPATILGLENFAAEANTLYEINILDNRAVVGSWAVST